MTDPIRQRRQRVAMTAGMMLVLLIVVAVKMYVGALVMLPPMMG